MLSSPSSAMYRPGRPSAAPIARIHALTEVRVIATSNSATHWATIVLVP